MLENWLSGCFAFVKWYDSHSSVFNIRFGVRRGLVLSPYLFLIYIDDVGKLCDFRNGSFVLLYADDILLISSSVLELQSLVTASEKVLLALDMSLNAGKSCCMRIGSRYDKPCANVCTHDGRQLSWVSSRSFKCSLDHAKRSFYRAANCIFGKIRRIASEDVLIELLKTKCRLCQFYCMDLKFAICVKKIYTYLIS